MAGYNRISPNPFVDGAIIEASDFDTEFGTLDTAFGTSGHTHDGTDGNGPKIDTAGLALNAVDSTILDETDSSYAVAGMTIDSLTITSGTAVTSIDTDITSVSASDDTLASAKAIKTYVDAQVTASDLDFQGDSGGALSIDLDSETLTIAGGTGLTTTGSGNTLTVDIDSTVATLSGNQTLSNKILSSPSITGNLTTDGNIDGRDVATDGAKLDGIETGADVTDSTNVQAAGALMDSEVTNLAQVKAFSSADYATAAQGTTADSALQPADNISELTNDSGYITDYTVTSADVTAHQANLSITESQISDLGSYITGNQTITLSGDATGSGTTSISVALAANTVGVNELNLTDGTAGQFLKTNGAGTISFADAPTQQTSFSSAISATDSTTFAIATFTYDEDNAFPASIILDKDTTTPADGERVGRVTYRGRDDGGSITDYVYAEAKSTDVTNGSEEGSFNVQCRTGSSLSNHLVLNSGGLWSIGSLSAGARLSTGVTGSSHYVNSNVDLRFDAGKGIDFSDTTDATGMSSELLDDYEEGTWTPFFFDGTSSTSTGNDKTGRYVKIGQQVTIWANITNASTSGLTSGNSIYIRGLPFTPFNDNVGISTKIAMGSGVLTSGVTHTDNVLAYIPHTTSLDRVYLWDGGADTAITVSDVTSGTNEIHFCITYLAS